MTEAQKCGLSVLACIITEFHHGDCVGADAEAHEIFGDEEHTVIHPPANASKRAWCEAKTILPVYDYLDRNHAIVDETDLLIACPAKDKEQLRSGTWATVRYARKLSRPVIIITPAGNIE